MAAPRRPHAGPTDGPAPAGRSIDTAVLRRQLHLSRRELHRQVHGHRRKEQSVVQLERSAW